MARFIFMILIGFLFAHSEARNFGIPVSSPPPQTYFIENKGQWPSEALFVCRKGNLDIWITKNGVRYAFHQLKLIQQTQKRDPSTLLFENQEENYELIGHNVFLTYQNTKIPQAFGVSKLKGYHNYFIGNDPSRHVSFVPLYQEIVLQDIYPGIDLRYYFDQGKLRYDFIVHPGADPSQISFTLEGQYNAYLKNGALCFTTCFGEVTIAKLKTFQDDKIIPSQFIRNGNLWKIKVENYDRTKPLIIDPLIFATFLGGSNTDLIQDVTLDKTGNPIVTGYTSSPNFPTTAGAYNSAYVGNYDIFVTKLDDSGSQLLFSTFIGGGSSDCAYALSIDTIGNIFLTGYTYSPDFPITTGAFDDSFNGDRDVVVIKLDATGSSLLFSTFLGGSKSDIGYDIAIDDSGNVYITGQTKSSTFPTTPGAYDTTFNNPYGGYQDVFVTKLNSLGSQLLFSTFIGSPNGDIGYAIVIDNNYNPIVTGIASSGFPTTPSSYDTSHNGSSDVFVLKLNSTGSQLLFSTFIGGSSMDEPRDLVLDSNGNIIVVGSTFSSNFPTTIGAFDGSFNGGYTDAFVTKLNASGSMLFFSTFIGGTNTEGFSKILRATNGHLLIAGTTYSSDFPITSNAYDTLLNGGGDAVLVKLHYAGAQLLYSTFIGGTNDDASKSIALDINDNPIIVGSTKSPDFPTTPTAYDTSYNGGSEDAFIIKLCFSGPMAINLTSPQGTDNQTICIDSSLTPITYSTAGATGATFNGLPNGVSGTFNNGLITISGTPTSSGTYNYVITLTGGCGNATATGTITVNPNNTITLTSPSGTDSQTVCLNDSITPITYFVTGASAVNITGLPDGVSWTYDTNNGILSISGVPDTIGTYIYTIELLGGCGNSTTNGTLIVDACTIINNDSFSKTSWHFYPNPNNGSFIIQTAKPTTFEFIDLTGKILDVFIVNKTLRINKTLPAGTYFLREQTTGLVKRIIIQPY